MVKPLLYYDLGKAINAEIDDTFQEYRLQQISYDEAYGRMFGLAQLCTRLGLLDANFQYAARWLHMIEILEKGIQTIN